MGQEADSVQMHWMWRETINRLDVHAKRVSENKGLDAALEFVNYLQTSGLVKFFERSSQPEPLKVDGSFLRWRCRELQNAVRDRYRTNDVLPHVEASELEAISRKLDVIAAGIAKLSPPFTATPNAGNVAAPEPALRVLQGGAS